MTAVVQVAPGVWANTTATLWTVRNPRPTTWWSRVTNWWKGAK
mgnify:CR=1 FL=1